MQIEQQQKNLSYEFFTFYCFQSLLKAHRVQEAQVPTGIWYITFISVFISINNSQEWDYLFIFSSQKFGMVSRISSAPQAAMTNFLSLKAFKKS